MITNFLIPEVNNHDVQELWFQQDGATCHTARTTIDLLKDTFGDHLISRFGPVNWPPRSCDLTPLDYFLWGYVNSLVYADKPQTLDHLEDNIAVLLPIYCHKCWEKSSKIGRPDWTTSEPAVTVLCQKSYLKCNMLAKYQMIKLIEFCGVWFLPESVARVAAIVGDHRSHMPRH
ncbi:transposable element Tc3 transposase [Trichonephila clavipes]|nr:transposable element Tc3 transposase [Trichonephila clavipes]